MRKFLQGFGAGCALLLLCGSGWTANQRLTGEYKTIQQIDDLDVVYFPKKYAGTTIREVHSADSSISVTYASIARKTGTGLGQFVFHSTVFPANAETVYVGDSGYSFSGGAAGLSKITPITLSGSTFQVEAAK